MSAISKNTFQFLKDLHANNHREWFNDNKKRYELAKTEFEEFIDALIGQIGLFDGSIMHHRAKECVFRIYRDVRFSKDKSPYKTHFGAHISKAVKKSEIHSRAGYYIHIEPGQSMLAGGAYLPEATWLKAIRQEIQYNTKEFNDILNGKDFKQYFGAMEGEKLKTMPKGFAPDHPAIELLKHKSFLATHQCQDSEVLKADFLTHSANVFKALYPFDQFLNRALD